MMMIKSKLHDGTPILLNPAVVESVTRAVMPDGKICVIANIIGTAGAIRYMLAMPWATAVRKFGGQ